MSTFLEDMGKYHYLVFYRHLWLSQYIKRALTLNLYIYAAYESVRILFRFVIVCIPVHLYV